MACLIVIILALFYYVQRLNSDFQEIKTSKIIFENEDNQEFSESDYDIVVYIAGEVKNEGMLYLKQGDRIMDAILAAGGLTENGDINSVNPSELLFDGKKIVILPIQGYIDKIPNLTDNKSNGLIDLNKASKSELLELPGLSEKVVGQIMKFRDFGGKFFEIEDLLKLPGMTEKEFDLVKKFVTVSDY